LTSGDQVERAAGLQRVAAALRAGTDLTDAAFDALLPRRYRWVSERHWTPLVACRDAARWLAPGPDARVLDVGAGVGKLCLAGSLLTGASFVGIEQRPHLVHAARALAGQLGATGATFVRGDALDFDWREFSSIYFYNPFAEPLFPEPMRIDLSVQQSEPGQALCVARLLEKLAGLRRGTRVVAYHDLGCALPDGFVRVEQKWSGHSALELWTRE
jgi:SAM-dependent methyltransferase